MQLTAGRRAIAELIAPYLMALCAGFIWQAAPAMGGSAVPLGSFGPEGPRLREQLWIVPGADAAVPLRATVFRPRDDGRASPQRRPLAVINHGSDEGRQAAAMPVFYWLSRWFVEHGYVVLLPQRRGHGATGGEAVEARDSCADPDHYAAGLDAADDIEGAVQFMRTQSFIDSGRIVVVGISTGGWGALALAARNPPGVRLVVNFAGGRGGHAYGRRNAICAPDRLTRAAADYAATANVPTLWLYSANDTYFNPRVASSLATAWRGAGGKVDLAIVEPYGSEGHRIADDRAGWDVWGDLLAKTLARHVRAPELAFVR